MPNLMIYYHSLNLRPPPPSPSQNCTSATLSPALFRPTPSSSAPFSLSNHMQVHEQNPAGDHERPQPEQGRHARGAGAPAWRYSRAALLLRAASLVPDQVLHAALPHGGEGVRVALCVFNMGGSALGGSMRGADSFRGRGGLRAWYAWYLHKVCKVYVSRRVDDPELQGMAPHITASLPCLCYILYVAGGCDKFSPAYPERTTVSLKYLHT